MDLVPTGAAERVGTSVAGPAVAAAEAKPGGIREDIVPNMLVFTAGDVDHCILSIMRLLLPKSHTLKINFLLQL